MTFCLVPFCLAVILVKLRTYRQTEYNAYEPTVHTHRWAKMVRNSVFLNNIELYKHSIAG